MADTFVEEEIKVEAVSTKFGGAVKSGNEWLNFSKGIDLSPASLTKGQTYKMQLAINDKGKRYINGLVGESGSSSSKDNGKTGVSTSFTPQPKSYDHNRGQMLGGLSHDVATIVASIKHKSVAEAMIAFEAAMEDIVRIRKKYD